MKVYLLDTNIYISFYDRYYPIDFFPSFWKEFTPIFQNKVVVPDVVVAENQQSKWFRQNYLIKNYQKPIISHKDYFPEWQEVLKYIASSNFYSEKALTSSRTWTHEKIADGWLIAIAKKEGFTIVTDEDPAVLNIAKPSKNPKIPDVANEFNVHCIKMLDFFGEVGLKV